MAAIKLAKENGAFVFVCVVGSSISRETCHGAYTCWGEIGVASTKARLKLLC
jgi:glucosamine 6-phosphate synthetase-like amidotransferase/phosphosugar isomerase protein